MKKSIRIIAVAMITLILCLTLASCGKTISGKYTGKTDLFGLAGAEVTYSFSPSKVTITTVAEIFGFEKTSEFEGKYEIAKDDEGNQTITFTFEDSDAKSYNGTLPFEKTEEGVKIGGVQFTKVK